MRLVWFLRELCLQTIGLVFTKPAAVTLNFTSNSRFPSVCPGKKSLPAPVSQTTFDQRRFSNFDKKLHFTSSAAKEMSDNESPKTDKKTKTRNTQSKVSAKKSSGEQQSARGPNRVRANQQENGPRGRENSSFAEENPVRYAAKMPALPTRNRESATAVRARKCSGNKKLLPAVPELSRRATRISGAPVNAITINPGA